jgi:zinc protease
MGCLLSVLSGCASTASADRGGAEVSLGPRTGITGRSSGFSVPKLSYTHRTLANGIQVYALRDPTTANVSVQMVYRVGSRDDPEGRTGLAHLFEHVLSRVTRNIPRGELSTIVEGLGGLRNATTSEDATTYYEVVPARHLEAMIWSHRERLDRLVLDEEVFRAERDIVKEEIRQRILAPPYARLHWLILFENSFNSHPYRRPAAGKIEDLDAATLTDARSFYENFYRPDNATLIVSGNFDPAQLDRMVDTHLAPIARPKTPIVRFRGEEIPAVGGRRLVSYGPNVPAPAIAWTYPIPPASHRDTTALLALDAVLTVGNSSRLYRSLVHEKELASQASALMFNLKEGGFYAPIVTLAKDRSVEEAEAALAAEISRVREEPISPAELAEVKSELIAKELAARETPHSRGLVLGQALSLTGDPRSADAYVVELQRLTAADIQRVARQYLSEDRRVAIRYLDEAARGGAAVAEAQPLPPGPLGLTLPPPRRAPVQLAPEAERERPPAASAFQSFLAPQLSERRLPNGLRVIVAKSTGLPLTAATLVIGGGAAVDPTGKSGVANLTSLAAREATSTLTPALLAERSESLGARISGVMSQDATQLSLLVPSANLEAAGKIFADIAVSPALTDADVERRRKAALDTLARDLRLPNVVATQAFLRTLYGSAPYASPISGTEATLGQISAQDVRQYHQQWWRPDNATLIITGGLDPAEAHRIAESLFGSWASSGAGPVLPPKGARAGPLLRPRVIVIDQPRAEQAAIVVGLRSVERSNPHYDALALGNAVLGVGSSGRLFQEIRGKRGLAFAANSAIGIRADEGPLLASVQTRNEGVAEVVQLTLQEFTRLSEEPIDADLLARRKEFLTGTFGRSVETSQGLASFLGTLVAYQLPLADYEQYLPRLQAISSENIRKAFAIEARPAQMTIVIVGKAAVFVDALKRSFPQIEVIAESELDLSSPTLGSK